VGHRASVGILEKSKRDKYGTTGINKRGERKMAQMRLKFSE
jgi:hypothetical protein